jgi:ribosomal protein S18 acetylase RimI-like enzyme
VIGSAPAVRLATREDVAPMSRALGRAFYDDPVMGWMFPDDRRRVDLNTRFFALRLNELVKQEVTYTTDGHVGAAVWTLPGRWRLPMLAETLFALRLTPIAGRRGPTLMRGWQRVDAVHPKQPHYYLAILGTEPESQGGGAGSALMGPVLESCDRDEIPAYLESSKERNIAFYARHGFRVTGAVDLPRGPRVWPMWRDPRP